MSNDNLNPDIYALQQSVVMVLSQAQKLMNYASQKLDTPNSGDRRCAAHSESIENEITKVKNLELRMAIVAPMKAGKSTIINAIVGQDILPSRNTAMTTLPTEIVFSKEVTEPKLKLRYDGADTFDVLKRSWGSLKGKIREIGLNQAKESTKDYPHLQYLLEEVAGNPERSFVPETSGTEFIQTSLTKLNDLVRLCSVLMPSDNTLMSLPAVPRLEVPPSSTLKLEGIGKLVFVDTPGPNEAGDLKLDVVVKRQLDASSIVLLVLDFTQLNTEASEKVKSDVDEVAKIKGLESIYVLINKIDQRKEKGMTKEQVLEFVNSKFGIEASTDRVFEISASRAAYASNFRNEKKKGFTNPQDMKTSDALGGQYYGDSWRKKFREKVDMADMEEAATDVWSESGFAEFLEKAIAALMAQAAPLTLFNALYNVRKRLEALQESINVQKNAFGKDIQTLQGQIAALERDLTILVDCQNRLKTQVKTLAKTLEKDLSKSLLDMKEQSNRELKKIFADREFGEAGLVKKFGIGISRMATLFSGVTYQGSGSIEFKSQSEADSFIEGATASARDIVNNLMSNAREDALKQIKKSRQNIESLLKKETKPIIEQAQRRLKEQFNVSLQLPDIFDDVELEQNISLNVSAKEDTRVTYEKKIVKERRWYTLGLMEHDKEVKERLWYTLWLVEHNKTPSTGVSTSRTDWDNTTRTYEANEVVTNTETFYTVSIDRITSSVNQSISSAVDNVNSQIFNYLQEDFQSVLNKFFDDLDRFLKGYREDLQRTIEAGKRSKEDRAALKLAFDDIWGKSSTLINDVDTQTSYVKQHLPKRNQ